MSFRGFLSELRHRGVLKVATAYLATGFLVLEGVILLFQSFDAPHWVSKVFGTFVILGFPLACLLAWGFEFTPQGVRSAPPLTLDSTPAPRRTDAVFGGLLLLIFALVATIVVQQWRAPVHATAQDGTVPIVIIMDTAAPHGVYDQDARDNSGTNADLLSETLRDLPIVLHKETVSAIWDREDQIIKQDPALILIHRSSLFHSMNQELGFGYPGEATYDETRFKRLYAIADNKLVALLGFIGELQPNTLFLVYGRGTGGGWEDEQYRVTWVEQLEGRFPSLKGRVTTLAVPGGVATGSLHDEKTRQLFRQRVRVLLALDESAHRDEGKQGR